MGALRHMKACVCSLTPQKFTCAKTVQIVDWRLAFVYWTLVGGTVFYFFFNLYMSRSYLETVEPIGATSHWAGSSMTSSLRFDESGFCNSNCGHVSGYDDGIDKMWNWSSATTNDTSFAYCNNPSYDFTYSADWVYGPFQCSFPEQSQVWKKTLNTIFVQTAMEKATTKCFRASSGVRDNSACVKSFADNGVVCNEGAVARYRAGRCCCGHNEFFFNVGPEHLSVEFDHSFTSMHSGSVDTGKGVRPSTIVKRANCEDTDDESCDMFRVNPGESIAIPLQELLQKLGIDLDGDSCSQPGGQNSNLVDGKCPRSRLTGMQLELTTSFYNFDMHKGPGMSFTASEPVSIIEVAPKITWNSLGNDIARNDQPVWAKGTRLLDPVEITNHYKYGITILFKNVTGKIGRFDYFLLFNTLIQVVVLMGLATSVATYMARFCMGKLSRTYDVVINETMSFKRELSRFACQALISNFVLYQLDSDHNQSIGSKEVHKCMRPFFTDTLGLEDAESCSKALIEILRGAGDMGVRSNSSVHPAGDNAADVLQLIDWMTDDRITMDLLIQELKDRVLSPEELKRQFSSILSAEDAAGVVSNMMSAAS